MQALWYTFLNFIYDMVRKIYWGDYGPNEDFFCMQCNKPVFRRILFCCLECEKSFEDKLVRLARRDEDYDE